MGGETQGQRLIAELSDKKAERGQGGPIEGPGRADGEKGWREENANERRRRKDAGSGWHDKMEGKVEENRGKK